MLVPQNSASSHPRSCFPTPASAWLLFLLKSNTQAIPCFSSVPRPNAPFACLRTFLSSATLSSWNQLEPGERGRRVWGMWSRRVVELLLACCPRQREKQCGSLVATRHSQTLPGRSLSIRERGESYSCSISPVLRAPFPGMWERQKGSMCISPALIADEKGVCVCSGAGHGDRQSTLQGFSLRSLPSHAHLLSDPPWYYRGLFLQDWWVI